jgi:hypothetical protein
MINLRDYYGDLHQVVVLSHNSDRLNLKINSPIYDISTGYPIHNLKVRHVIERFDFQNDSNISANNRAARWNPYLKEIKTLTQRAK